MSKKLNKRVNGSLAIYWGIGSLLAFLGCLVATIIVSYRALFGTGSWNWEVFLFMIFLMVLMGVMGYALLKIGYEEVES